MAGYGLVNSLVQRIKDCRQVKGLLLIRRGCVLHKVLRCCGDRDAMFQRELTADSHGILCD